MGYAGTRERIYQARTPADVIGGMEDELHTRGWMPLTRELRADGSLRVIYERLPDEVDGKHADLYAVPAGRDIRADVAVVVAAVTITCVMIGLAFLTTPA
jgi:hypothetical protein